jgi:hypothetical protein
VAFVDFHRLNCRRNPSDRETLAPVMHCSKEAECLGHVFCAGASAPLNVIHHHAVEMNVPIGCGGVAGYPGDIIVNDVGCRGRPSPPSA